MKIRIDYINLNLLTVIAFFSLILFSNSLLKISIDHEDNLINSIFGQNRNAFAVGMDVEDDEEKSFEYVFDPSDYIEDADSEKELDSNTNNNVEDDTQSIKEYEETGLSHDNKEDKDESTFTSKSTKEEESDHKSDFNFVAVGDWDCKSETKDTVENILEQDPEVVLALGDLSYNGNAECWLDIIEPIADKTEIAIGNHEHDSSKTLRDYIQYFGLEKQYYSFNYKTVHFIALSTEIPYEEGSQQYEFVVQDLEESSKDRSIDWIVAFYHRQAYSSGGGPEDDDDFRDTYHPLFDKYRVDLALQGHFHAYERLYPISFNYDDGYEPIVEDYDPSYYINPKGTIFITAGTGGAHDMKISEIKPFSAFGLDGKFGILNISVENNGITLKGSFIENNDEEGVYDQFQIIKER
ncbi:MAG TPA: metallophosphoesterase [Nitrososphaeraceae archaeon]|nr:metallophosphoesterase [Nitrososphaeraceae archaeon]